MKPVRVSDLKDQTGLSYPRPFLLCTICGKESSANRDDYFAAPMPGSIFTCCNVPMELVTRRVQFIPAMP